MGCKESKVSDVTPFVNSESSKFINDNSSFSNQQEKINNDTYPTILVVKPFDKTTCETNNETKKPKDSPRTQEDNDDSDEKNYNVNEWKQMIEKLRKNKKLNDYCLSKEIVNFKDLNELAEFFINSPAQNETEKAWSVYFWVANNIKYDYELFKKGSYKNENDPENVLKSGKCVCEGYARLYQRLCQKLGLECVRIGGYSKAFGYKIGQILSESDHAWNAVKIDYKWQYVESTWAAGSLTSKGFDKKFEAYYFATPPQIFIESHYFQPFQLQKKKITLEEFCLLPMNKLSFHLNGLKCLNFNTSVIETNKHPLVIEYTSPKHTLLKADLLDETSGEEIKNSVFIQRDLGLTYALIVFIPEAKKNYMLNLYARSLNNKSEKMLSLASQYLIRKTPNAIDVDLPKFKLLFDPYDIKCISHETVLIKESKNPIFIEFKVPDNVIIVAHLHDQSDKKIEDSVLIQRDFNTKLFGVNVLLPSAEQFKLKLFAKYSNDNGPTYDYVNEFLISGMSNEVKNVTNSNKYEIFFTEFGVKCLSHSSLVIKEKRNPILVEFDVPENVLIIAEMYDERNKKLSDCLMIQRDGNSNKHGIFVLIQKLAQYKLKLFGKYKNENGLSYECFGEFRIFSETEKFENFLCPKYDINYEEFGLKCLSHNSQLISSKENILTMEFFLPKSTEIMAELKDMKKTLLPNRTFIQNSKNGNCELKVSLDNNQNIYSLNIFAKHSSDQRTTYSSLAEYWILCHELSSNKPTIEFPKQYSVSNINYKIYFPLEFKLKANKLYEFRIYIENVLDVAFVDENGTWTHFLLDLDEKDMWILKKQFQTLGKLNLFVQLPEKSNYNALFFYQVE